MSSSCSLSVKILFHEAMMSSLQLSGLSERRLKARSRLQSIVKCSSNAGTGFGVSIGWTTKNVRKTSARAEVNRISMIENISFD